MIDQLQAFNPLFNGHLFAESISIHGAQVPVCSLEDAQLRAQIEVRERVSSKRAARLLFGAMVFVIEAQCIGQACRSHLSHLTVGDRFIVFGIGAGLVWTITWSLMGRWLRRNLAVMRRHNREHAIAVAELDRRRPPLADTKLPQFWPEFKRRARIFFYE